MTTTPHTPTTEVYDVTGHGRYTGRITPEDVEAHGRFTPLVTTDRTPEGRMSGVVGQDVVAHGTRGPFLPEFPSAEADVEAHGLRGP